MHLWFLKQAAAATAGLPNVPRWALQTARFRREKSSEPSSLERSRGFSRAAYSWGRYYRLWQEVHCRALLLARRGAERGSRAASSLSAAILGHWLRKGEVPFKDEHKRFLSQALVPYIGALRAMLGLWQSSNPESHLQQNGCDDEDGDCEEHGGLGDDGDASSASGHVQLRLWRPDQHLIDDDHFNILTKLPLKRWLRVDMFLRPLCTRA